MKTVKIACTGADMADPADFKPLQGALKELAEDDYHRLKQLIIDFGFSDPVNAWENNNQKFIVSGHQRVATLLRMRQEGYTVPYIPYNLVDAENEHEAKMKVLGAASQFGKITTMGLRAFMDDLSLDIADLEQGFALPGIDMPALAASESREVEDIDVSAHTRTLGSEKINEKEIDENISTKNECPSCGYKW